LVSERLRWHKGMPEKEEIHRQDKKLISRRVKCPSLHRGKH